VKASFFSKYPPRVYYVLWLLILGLTAWLSEGWLQPDEQARVLEPAHFLAYGVASLPWELSAAQPVVSWLIGALMAPILMATKWMGIGGLGEAAIIRFLFGCFASTRFFALFEILKRLNFKKSRQLFYILVMMLAVFGPVFLVRTSQENVATTCLIWAFFWALRMNDEGFTRARGFLFGMLLAFTVSFRPQLGLAAAGLGLWQLRRQGAAIILPAVCGILTGLIPLAIVDYQTTGGAFYPAMNYLKYALGDENGGRTWGTSPWWFYIQGYFESWYPPLSPLLLLPLIYGLIVCPALAAVVIPYTAAHFILGHKETRYFSPMIPFLQISMFMGLERLEAKSPFVARVMAAESKWLKALTTLAILTLLVGFFPLNSSPWMYDEVGRQLRSGKITRFTYVGNTMSAFSEFYSKAPESVTYSKVSWNDVRDGIEAPEGWLAFYCLDPEDFLRIEQKCGTKGLQEYPDWYIKAMMRLPRSPARRRLNPIIYCPHPLHFAANNE
jgi:Alg9-like mannosyltransferase family